MSLTKADGGSGQCLWLRSEHVLLVIMRPRNELNFENVLLTCNFEITGPKYLIVYILTTFSIDFKITNGT